MRIACFTPLNPQPSGISDYSEALLPHLARHAQRLDVFIEDYEPSGNFPRDNLQIRHWREFEADYRAGAYDVVLYHVGNNPFHVYIYDLALRIPGVLVLHEFNLHYLVADATIARSDWEAYFQELEYNAGPLAVDAARQAQAGFGQLDYDGIAMNRRLLETSPAAIVHSQYMVRRVRGAGFALPVQKIPHGVEIPTVDRLEARQQLSALTGWTLEDSVPVLGIFGFLKPYKRIRETLLALARLRPDYPQARMILVGEEHPQYPLRPLIAELRLEEVVRILGYVSLESFTTCLAACDLSINLRRPTAGETSGGFLRALALGKPCLISEIGAFQEVPEDVAVKIPVDDREVDWLSEYLSVLLDNSELAQAIGERGRAFVERECGWPQVAGQYTEFLRQCVNSELPTPARANEIAPAPAPTRPSVSPEELEGYILGFSHATKPMEDYVWLHRKRLVKTLEITPPGKAEDRVLELGCYLQLTPALGKYLGYGEVRGAYYGPAGQNDLRSATSDSGEVFSCWIDLFDAERDPFPYPDDHFHTVLCGELVEHLSTDPMHMMAEINRILCPGGCLILTTPNVVSLRSVQAVLQGYHPGLFHAYIKPNADGAVDPRHSREYTPREVASLMQASGFEVELLETGDYGKPDPALEPIRELLRAHQCPVEWRGEIIYCRARKTGPVRERWPKDFYYPPE
ncbi:MAG: glycosyltransferase [Acidobacteria bacterium]|nr:glycosyltransferase [Acidobacteriota bacterium]